MELAVWHSFMSEFMLLDAETPATVEAVVEAVVRLSAFSEEQLLEMVSAGKLHEMFPFRPISGQSVPPDYVSEGELVEASALPLSREQRNALLEASLPAAERAKPRQGFSRSIRRPAGRKQPR